MPSGGAGGSSDPLPGSPVMEAVGTDPTMSKEDELADLEEVEELLHSDGDEDGPSSSDEEWCLPLAGPRASPASSTAVKVGSIGIYGSRRTRTCAACLVDRTLSATRALDARSTPLPSAVLATLWPALEGIFVSPCSPTDIPLCAGRVSGVSATIFAHQVLESAPESARALPRRARLARVRAQGVPRRGRRFMGRERVGGGVRRRSWRLSISKARGAYAGVRRVAVGRRGARRGLAARART